MPDMKHMFKRSFFFGYGFSIGHFYWIGFSFLVRGGVLSFFFPFVFLFIPAYFAFYYVLPCLILQYLRVRYNLGKRSFYLLFAILWVLFEVLRSNMLLLVSLSGFPWGLLGYDIFFSDNLAQFAEYISVYGLSLFILLLTSVPFLWRNFSKNNFGVFALFIAVLYCFLSFSGQKISEKYQDEKKVGISYKIIHPDFEEHHGFNEQNLLDNLYKMKELSTEGKQSDLIIWPEGTVSYFIEAEDPEQDLLAFITQDLFENQFVIVGAPRISEDKKFYNSMFLSDSQGSIMSFYDKERLVPFGEFMPFRFLFNILPIVSNSGDFTPGKGGHDFQVGDIKISGLICYDALFPNIVSKAESDLIVNISNDIWFIHEVAGYNISIAPFQHLDMIRMRAIESRQRILRATNRGISAEIDATGEVKKLLSYSKNGIIEGDI